MAHAALGKTTRSPDDVLPTLPTFEVLPTLDDQAHELPQSLEQARPIPAPRVLATYATAAEIRAATGWAFSKGAIRLHEAIHDFALANNNERGYTVPASQITYHLPAVTLAGLLNYHPDHVTRLGRELERAGILDCGGHAQSVMGCSMYDGSLWCLLMVPGGQPPRITAAEWQHNWRPTFTDDVRARTGAAAEMSGLRSEGATEEEKFKAARARAVNPGAAHGKNPPPLSSPDNLGHVGLKAVVEGLGRLWHLHHSKRARAVGLLASKIAAALMEPERRRYWCRVIWEALKAENEGRGGLQVLGAQLARMVADLQEGAPWRSPGAVLAARLKTA